MVGRTTIMIAALLALTTASALAQPIDMQAEVPGIAEWLVKVQAKNLRSIAERNRGQLSNPAQNVTAANAACSEYSYDQMLRQAEAFSADMRVSGS